MYNTIFYENTEFYEDFFKDFFKPQKIKKEIKSEFFYNGKDYNYKVRYNNEENYIFINFDIVVNNEKKEDLKEIFINHKGKFKPFWLEVYNNKIELYDDANIDDNFLNVKKRNYTTNLNSRKKHLCLRSKNYNNNNNYQLLKIESIDDLLEYEKINLSQNLIYDIKKGEEIINELLYIRFNLETLSFKRISRDLFTVSLSFKELIQETP